jgi:heme-degrading monooxygenase HmoA
MIVRVLTGRVAPRREGEFNEDLRRRLSAISSQPGNVYVKFARKIEGDRERVILITEWATPADLYAWIGDDVDRPHFVDLALLDDWHIDHWEALDRTPLDETWPADIDGRPPSPTDESTPD